jgi:hypothetical protein
LRKLTRHFQSKFRFLGFYTERFNPLMFLNFFKNKKFMCFSKNVSQISPSFHFLEMVNKAFSVKSSYSSTHLDKFAHFRDTFSQEIIMQRHFCQILPYCTYFRHLHWYNPIFIAKNTFVKFSFFTF